MSLTLQEAIWNKYIKPTERETVNLSRRPVHIEEIIERYAALNAPIRMRKEPL